MLLALVATVALGLASRAWPLPGLLAEHTGDALYAVALFWGLAWLGPRRPWWQLSAMAWLASAAVELSQLATWPWIMGLRATRLGALVLGHGFQWADLLAYAIGASGVGLLAAWAFKARPASPSAAPR